MNVSKLLKITGKIVLILSFVLLVLVILISFLSHFTNNGRGTIGKYSFGIVATGSMEPDISTGSFIFIEQVNPQALKVGDIITFRSSDPTVPNGMPVTHKIVRIDHDEYQTRYFVTKGSANPDEDQYPVYDRDLLGRVIFDSSVLGSIVLFTQNQWLFPILIAILAINLVISMISVAKEAQNLKDQSNC